MHTMPNGPAIRIGTRKSLLARAQSDLVAAALRAAHPGLSIELVPIVTTGDRMTDLPLADAGGKGLFIKELEIALLEGRIDLAVHSYKDVPVTMPLVDQDHLVIAAVPLREDPHDSLIVAESLRGISRLADLPATARVGTGSVRRRCQLLAIHPKLQIEPVRGNIDTRLKKLAAGQFDAIILARAGLVRAALWDDRGMIPLRAAEMLPAAGQGALALQSRRDDTATRQLVFAIDDAISARSVQIERQVVRLLGGDCHSPIGALATIEGDILHLEAALGAPGGQPPVRRGVRTGPLRTEYAIAADLCRELTRT